MPNSITDDSWIFVNYVPGSFGSFITKVIESSPDIIGTTSKEIFDQNGASHLKRKTWIKKFHHGDDLDRWYNSSEEKQIKYIKNNIVDSEQSGIKVHRLTVPKYHDQFVKVFPNAKFVKICFNDNLLPVVAEQFCNKTFDDWINSEKQKNTNLEQMDISTQKEYYLNVCYNRIQEVRDCKKADQTLLFDIEKLINGTEEFEHLFKYLNIAPGDYKSIYTKFLDIHRGIL